MGNAEWVAVLRTNGAEEATDLVDWLHGERVSGAMTQTRDESMGDAETVTLILAGTASLRSAFVVLREWVRARRTELMVEVDGRRFELSTSTDDAAIVTIVDAIQATSPNV